MTFFTWFSFWSSSGSSFRPRFRLSGSNKNPRDGQPAALAVTSSGGGCGRAACLRLRRRRTPRTPSCCCHLVARRAARGLGAAAAAGREDGGRGGDTGVEMGSMGKRGREDGVVSVLRH